MRADQDAALVLDIVTAARDALAFVRGLDAERFREDAKSYSAVLYQIMIVGEAAKKLSPKFRATHPELPWSQIARMRDRLIHHYRKTDLGEVWRTVENDLPELLRVLEPLMEREEPP